MNFSQSHYFDFVDTFKKDMCKYSNIRKSKIWTNDTLDKIYGINKNA